MDCDKVSKLVDQIIETVADSWHDGIEHADSTTALNRLSEAKRLIDEAIKEIKS